MDDFSKKEIQSLKELKTPSKIQDFLNKIPINFENEEETCLSPLCVLRNRKAHCMEGALLALFCLELNNQKGYLMHLKTIKGDLSHVICVYKKNGLYGAISKTNHSVLRFRDPVYKNTRELVMSYFHEYTDDQGKKTLDQYSDLLDQKSFKKGWEKSKENLWYIDKMLDKQKHHKIFSGKRNILRKADKIEIEAGKILEWQNKS